MLPVHLIWNINACVGLLFWSLNPSLYRNSKILIDQSNLKNEKKKSTSIAKNAMEIVNYYKIYVIYKEQNVFNSAIWFQVLLYVCGYYKKIITK